MRGALRRLVVLLSIGGVAFTAAFCATTGSVRRGPEGACVSDRECLYGLVCRGGEDGGASACQYENWGACKHASDCLAGHVCREGTCTVECVADGECDGGVCAIGQCRTREEKTCVVASDCPRGQDCIAGECVESIALRCMSDLDCRPGERCLSGWCR